MPAVGSDSETSKLLLAALNGRTLSESDRELFLEASDGITSDAYQTKVLAALVRAERRR